MTKHIGAPPQLGAPLGLLPANSALTAVTAHRELKDSRALLFVANNAVEPSGTTCRPADTS
ncbi:hypothetical protein [Streptomyces canus]|uniref:hypothetical protein n=1 Tax=Streptomyces canus TaxID=58343 RepID=UPI0032505B13